MSEPLHVQVARALGWTRLRGTNPERGVEPIYGQVEDVPRYDTDWSATGPLIERLGLSVRLSSMPFDARRPWTAWAGASDVGFKADVAHGSTPLIAICELILALHASGKLKAA